PLHRSGCRRGAHPPCCPHRAARRATRGCAAGLLARPETSGTGHTVADAARDHQDAPAAGAADLADAVPPGHAFLKRGRQSLWGCAARRRSAVHAAPGYGNPLPSIPCCASRLLPLAPREAHGSTMRCRPERIASSTSKRGFPDVGIGKETDHLTPAALGGMRCLSATPPGGLSPYLCSGIRTHCGTRGVR